jgi:hypothetical protein
MTLAPLQADVLEWVLPRHRILSKTSGTSHEAAVRRGQNHVRLISLGVCTDMQKNLAAHSDPPLCSVPHCYA